MTGIQKLCTDKAIAALEESPSTLSSELGRLAEDYGLAPPTVRLAAHNMPAELLEKTAGASYPAVHIYCERVSNALKQRFTKFSGTARMAASIRASHDRWEQVEQQAALLVEAITNLLEGKRGDWGDGVYYSGAYEVGFSSIRSGGKHFMQTALINFELDVVRP
jgi:hypothetical protein